MLGWPHQPLHMEGVTEREERDQAGKREGRCQESPEHKEHLILPAN